MVAMQTMCGGLGMVTRVNALFWTPLYTGAVVALLFFSSYRQIARIFKWMTLVLLAYVVTEFLASVDWHHALIATLLPLSSLVARLSGSASRNTGHYHLALSFCLAFSRFGPT